MLDDGAESGMVAHSCMLITLEVIRDDKVHPQLFSYITKLRPPLTIWETLTQKLKYTKETQKAILVMDTDLYFFYTHRQTHIEEDTDMYPFLL